jgi:hypothetical protein
LVPGDTERRRLRRTERTELARRQLQESSDAGTMFEVSHATSLAAWG